MKMIHTRGIAFGLKSFYPPYHNKKQTTFILNYTLLKHYFITNIIQ